MRHVGDRILRNADPDRDGASPCQPSDPADDAARIASQVDGPGPLVPEAGRTWQMMRAENGRSRDRSAGDRGEDGGGDDQEKSAFHGAARYSMPSLKTARSPPRACGRLIRARRSGPLVRPEETEPRRLPVTISGLAIQQATGLEPGPPSLRAASRPIRHDSDAFGLRALRGCAVHLLSSGFG